MLRSGLTRPGSQGKAARLAITSRLPDDSREADEHVAERMLRDLRGRVKAARAAISATPGLADTLHSDWQRAARFYARFGITETQFRHGVPGLDTIGGDNRTVDPCELVADVRREIPAWPGMAPS